MPSGVWILGRLGQDPELQETPKGTPLCEFSVASKAWRGKPTTDWVQCTAYGRTAENVVKHCEKGREIVVSGSLRQERWKNKDGENRSRLSVVADVVFFTSRPRDEEAEEQHRPVTDEDIPF